MTSTQASRVGGWVGCVGCGVWGEVGWGRVGWGCVCVRAGTGAGVGAGPVCAIKFTGKLKTIWCASFRGGRGGLGICGLLARGFKLSIGLLLPTDQTTLSD